MRSEAFLLSTKTSTQPRWLTLADAAEYLSVTDRTVRNYIARGELTGYRMGTRSLRIDARELDDLLCPIPTAGGAA